MQITIMAYCVCWLLTLISIMAYCVCWMLTLISTAKEPSSSGGEIGVYCLVTEHLEESTNPL